MAQTIEQMRDEMHGLMVVVGSISYGLEQVLGRGANAINYRAGRNLGVKGEVKNKTDDILKGLELLNLELKDRGIDWGIKPFKYAAESDYVYEVQGQKAIKLVFHNCLVRCSLFRFAHEQKQSLCQMEMGVLCGIMQKILNKKVDLRVLHAGENACLKELLVAP